MLVKGTQIMSDIPSRLSEIEARLSEIESRNSRVEIDKAWETSKTRIIFIVVLTYLLTSLVFYLIGVNDYYLNALIPTIGYWLSTQSVSLLKKYWVRKRSFQP
jgi:purine-cytosine permease-like protein